MTAALRPGWSPDRDAGSPAIEVALVNNMPDAAFEDAEAQFCGLLAAAAGERPVAVRLFSLRDADRGEPVRRHMAGGYESLAGLACRPPDALIVTGSEPRRASLRDDPLWDGLSGLVRWSVRSTTSAMFCCLAAHTALLDQAGVDRHRLPAKASGVYRQTVRRGHPLTAGLGSVACPHSRLNDVSAAQVEAAGYAVLLASRDAGWTVAAADGPCLTVLVQGHPEYSPTTLLREHRRDVGRYLAGQRPDFPAPPAGYLDAAGEALIESFRRQAVASRRAATDGSGGAAAAAGTGTGGTAAGRVATAGTAAAGTVTADRYPFGACTEHIAADWHRPMVRLFANWLTEVGARKQQLAWRRAG